MTDEEMAEEWVKQEYPTLQITAVAQRYIKAFLAGLKAGRPQWHFVSKEGFPSKDDIYLIIRNDGLHLGDYCCGGDGDIDCQSWCDYPSEEEIQDDSVIAWCEIPTFTDKE